MAEVRGSSPLSSTADVVSAPIETVGAHEFRNRFGIYLDRAAAGGEIQISRHGRPFARLLPAAPGVGTASEGHSPPRPHKIARP
jgi:prevent-host-death family protein